MDSIQLHSAYRARRIRFLDLWQHGGWRLKLYGIARDAPSPRDELVRALLQLAPSVLPQPARTASRYGLGFLCAHQGRTGDVAFVDWWEAEDELHHAMFVFAGGALRPAADSELTACIWDLAVIGFERDAWVDAILRKPTGPDPDAYLAARLDREV
jgi:hypothetical protein